MCIRKLYKQVKCVNYFLNSPNINSGDTVILVTAHMPAPISFTLAPSLYHCG